MAVIKLTQVIQASIETVFETVVDVANFPAWNPTTKSARKLSEGPAQEGTRFELEISGFGKTMQELREFEKNHRVRLVPHIRSLAGGHRFFFTTVPGGTRVDHELEMTPKGWFKLFEPFMGIMGRKNLRRTAEALKHYVEHS